MERLASGRRLNRASDDPAGLVISQRLEGRIRSIQQVHRNTYDGLSVVLISEGALGETSGLLVRLRELAVQSANGTPGPPERAAIGEEANALLAEVDRIAQTTRSGRQNLLDGTTDIEIVSAADMAEETAELTRAQLLEQTAIAAIVEERKQDRLILELLEATVAGESDRAAR